MRIWGFVFIYTKAACDKQGNACIIRGRWNMLKHVWFWCLNAVWIRKQNQPGKAVHHSRWGASLVDINKRDYSFEEATLPPQYLLPWRGWFTTERREGSRKSGGPTHTCRKGWGLITAGAAVQRVLAKTGRWVKEGTTCRPICCKLPGLLLLAGAGAGQEQNLHSGHQLRCKGKISEAVISHLASARK